MRAALLLPFLIAPAGVLLLLLGIVSDPHLPSVLVLGYILTWAGFFAAAPSAIYIVVVWLAIRPCRDSELTWTLVAAPPICGVISETLNQYLATGSLAATDAGERFFFKAGTVYGYAVVAVLLALYLKRRRRANANRER